MLAPNMSSFVAGPAHRPVAELTADDPRQSVKLRMKCPACLSTSLTAIYQEPYQADSIQNYLKRHYFATAGVRLQLSDDWSVVPSVLVKAVNPAPLSVDINAKLKYQDLLWAGVSWRAFDSAVAMVGLSYEQYTLGYSYDAGLSKLAGYNGGSHEVLVGLRLKKKAQVVCTNRFW